MKGFFEVQNFPHKMIGCVVVVMLLLLCMQCLSNFDVLVPFVCWVRVNCASRFSLSFEYI